MRMVCEVDRGRAVQDLAFDRAPSTLGSPTGAAAIRTPEGKASAFRSM